MNPEKDNFGVPKVDNSPVGIVGMEGNFFRGLTSKTPRSLFVRICIIAFGAVFFLLPGICILLVLISNYSELAKDHNWMGVIILAVCVFLFLGAGFAVIKANIKK